MRNLILAAAAALLVATPAFASIAVPEPGSFTLIALAVVAGGVAYGLRGLR